MADPSTEQIQCWMSTVLASRGDLRQKLSRAEDMHGLGIEQVRRSPSGPSPERRLDVYAAGYVLRLVECLRSEFPALQAFVGASVFEAFARAYIVEHPPRTRSLFDVGRDLPAFLARTAPSPERVPEEHRGWLDLPANIARLERAASEAVRAVGLETSSANAMTPHAQGVPCAPDLLSVLTGDVRVRPAPCLQLLELDYPLVDFCAELGRDGRPPPPRSEKCLVAISRLHWRVTRTTLEPWQFAFLRWLIAEPTSPLALSWNALDSEAAAGPRLAQLIVWLPVAEGLGLLQLHPSVECAAAELDCRDDQLQSRARKA